jgi:hypothetical protein
LILPFICFQFPLTRSQFMCALLVSVGLKTGEARNWFRPECRLIQGLSLSGGHDGY